MRSIPVGFVAACAVIVGSVAPWVVAPGVADSASGGLEHDGIATLILAFVATPSLALVAVRGARFWRVVFGVCSVFVTALAIFDVMDVTSGDGEALGASVGWGLWVTLVGGIGMLTATALAALRR